MPKIGPNKVSIDPKAYAARVTSAKKRVAQIDPATKAKLSEYYPEITIKDIAKQMTSPKTSLSDMAKRIKAKPTATPKATAGSLARRTPSKAAAKPMAKPAAKAPAKTTTKAPAKKTPMPKTPTMPTKPKPAIGADKAAKKKYGSASHNNGYTN